MYFLLNWDPGRRVRAAQDSERGGPHGGLLLGGVGQQGAGSRLVGQRQSGS